MFVNMLQKFISPGTVICHREGLTVIPAVSLADIPGNGFEGR